MRREFLGMTMLVLNGFRINIAKVNNMDIMIVSGMRVLMEPNSGVPVGSHGIYCTNIE
jgi:hypothetical protein